MKVWIDHEELWEPWEMTTQQPEKARLPFWDGPIDLPAELVSRFEKTKAEMQSIWDEMRTLMREDW